MYLPIGIYLYCAGPIFFIPVSSDNHSNVFPHQYLVTAFIIHCVGLPLCSIATAEPVSYGGNECTLFVYLVFTGVSIPNEVTLNHTLVSGVSHLKHRTFVHSGAKLGIQVPSAAGTAFGLSGVEDDATGQVTYKCAA